MIKFLRVAALAAAALVAVHPVLADTVMSLPHLDTSGNVKFPGGPTIGTWTGGVWTPSGIGMIGPGQALANLNAANLNGLTSPLNITSNAPTNPVYFAGLLPNAGMFINLNGLGNTTPLAPPPNPVGDPTAPLVGFVSSVVSNAGHGTAADNIAHYRAAALFQNTAYANAPSTTGVDIQMNYASTAPTDIPFIGLEVDMASSKSADCTQGAAYCTGILVTGTPANPNPAFSLMHGYLLEGASSTAFHQGYVIDSGVKDVGFLDESQSATGFEAFGTHTTGFLDASHSSGAFVVSGAAGSHTTGFFVAPGSTTGAQFASNGFQVDANGSIAIPTQALTASGVTASTRLIVPFATPATSTSACTVGQVGIDAAFIYTCVATNTWLRLASGATW